MTDIERKVMGGRTVTVYPSGTDGAQTVYVSMYEEAGQGILDACIGIGARPFNMVSITGLRWAEDLSPWPHDPMLSPDDRFTGGAEDYLRFIEREVIPYAEGILGASDDRVVAGYSMAGLLAMYAPFVSDAFSRCVSVSGSLWYPGFSEFVASSRFTRDPRAAYLSVGDRECRVRNRHMRMTEECTRSIDEALRSRGVESVFELNPGNHFQDAEARMARGMAWILERRSVEARRDERTQDLRGLDREHRQRGGP